MNAPTLTGSSTACVILPTDFNKNTADPNRRRWTAGQLRHVVAALAGTPVAITIDNQTGSALVGVVLLAVTPNSPGHDLLIEYTFADKSGAVKTQRTSYRIFSLGEAIIPMGYPNGGNTDAKFIATRTYADENTRAITVVRAKYGEVAGRKCGAWSAEPTLTGSIVRYTPHTGNPAFAADWGTPVSAEVVNGKIARIFGGN